MRRTRNDPRTRGPHLGVLLCALLLPVALVACTSKDTTQDTAGGAADTSGNGDPGVEDTSVPEPEDTAATEQADGSADQSVSVDLPGLPIGGSSVPVSDTLQCVDVGWTTPPDLPDWAAVTVTGVAFDPEGEFELSSEPCEGDTPSCLEGGVQLTSSQRCYVAVTWTGPTSITDPTMSFTSGEMTCRPDQVQSCEDFKAQVSQAGPQPVGLQPAPSDTGGDATGG